MSDIVFPEDPGTGASEGDFDDAANFSTLARAVGFGDYVFTGMNFTPDYSTPDVNISSGLAVIAKDTVSQDQGSEKMDQGNLFFVKKDSVSGLSLTDSAVNNIFLKIDLSSDDTASYEAKTSGTPSLPNIKIGEINTSSNTSKEIKRSAQIPTNYLRFNEKSSDPADPDSGTSIMWQSDGTGSGDDGDIMMKISDSGGTVKTATVVDFSSV